MTVPPPGGQVRGARLEPRHPVAPLSPRLPLTTMARTGPGSLPAPNGANTCRPSRAQPSEIKRSSQIATTIEQYEME